MGKKTRNPGKIKSAAAKRKDCIRNPPLTGPNTPRIKLNLKLKDYDLNLPSPYVGWRKSETREEGAIRQMNQVGWQNHLLPIGEKVKILDDALDVKVKGVQNLETMPSKDGVIYGYVSPKSDRLFIHDTLIVNQISNGTRQQQVFHQTRTHLINLKSRLENFWD